MVAVRHGPPRLHNLRNSPSTEQVDGHDVCRVNVPRATEPMWSNFKDIEKLFVRRNNSTRAALTARSRRSLPSGSGQTTQPAVKKRDDRTWKN